MLGCLDLDESHIEPVVDRSGHDRRYAVDTTKVEALGASRGRPFAPALEETVAWYVDNEWWWRPLRGGVRNR